MKLKKVLAVLLTVVLMVGAIPFGAFTASAETSGFFTYTVSDGEATIIDFHSAVSGVANIPSTLGGYPVTSIDRWAFSDCSSLTSITIPDSVTSIGDDAFSYCSSLTSITIPDSVTSIGGYTFYNCDSLTSITIPNGVTSIGDCAFRDCSSLTSITIPNGVTSIGEWTFSYCSSLTSITIPDGVTSIGEHTFYYCSSLTSITIPNSVTSIGDSAFSYCSSLTSITIPDSVTSIDDYAFGRCGSLTSITIPDSVTSIGNGAFYDCSSLSMVYYCGTEKQWDSIYIDVVNEALINATRYYHNFSKWVITKPATCTESGEKQHICSICGEVESTDVIPALGHDYKSVVTAPTCTENGYTTHTCANCGDSYTDNEIAALGHSYENGVCTVCGDVYTTTEFSYTVSNGEVTITGYNGTETEVVIPNYIDGYPVTKIGDNALSGKNMKSLIVSGNVKEIGNNAFQFCHVLERVVLNEGVISIGRMAFYDCRSLNSITIPNSLSKISSEKTFYACPINNVYICNLKAWCEIEYVSNHIVSNPSPLDGKSANLYLNGELITNLVLTDDITKITEYAFSGCNSIISVVIPNSITSIRGDAFYNCASINTVYYCGTEEQWNNITIGSYNECLTDATRYYHDFGEWITTKAATCTESGEKQRTCSICGEVETSIISATGHNYKSVVTAPTCSENGYTTHTCANCGDSYIDNEIAALGHSMVFVGMGCTPDKLYHGNDKGYQDSLYDPSIIDPSEPFVPPPEIHSAFEEYHCSVCGYVDYIYCDGETYTEIIEEPTCTEYGSKVEKCIYCRSYIVSYQDIDPLGHSFGDWITKTDATCTESGEKYRECSVCGHIETKAIPITDHDYKSIVTVPTCTENGYTTHTCANCGDSYIDNETVATGHNYKTVITEPTCFEDGTEYNECTVCGHIETKVIPSIGHHVYKETVVAPTCTKQGCTIYSCVNCDDVYVDDFVAALGHSFGEWITETDATCTEDGEEYRECSVCGHTETQSIPATGHDYKSVVTAPTCTENGYTTHTCANCGDSYIDTETAALGHNYKSVVTAPTCTENGYTTHTCENCGDSYIDSETDALGHNFGEWTTKTDATCTENGEEYRECSVCGHTETNVIPATGHNYESVVTLPTCTEKGYTTYTCTVCSDSYIYNYVNALGHSFGEWITETDASCTEDGEEYRECSICGHIETQVIPATGHNYSDEFTVDKAPTESEDGSVSRHCSVCDSRTDVAVIPKGALDFDACGKSAVWVLDADNTLYIIGSGETAGYSLPTKSPWYKYREDITTVKISQNITKIGNNSFSGLSNIGLVVVENPDMQFGAYVFKTDLALIMQCDIGGNVEAYANENGYPIIGLNDLIPPVAPTVLDFANGVVTLEHKDGCEYSCDGINWQSGNTFDNMPMDTVLCFYQRIAADGTNAASPASLAAKCIFVSAPKVLVGENMIWIEPEEGYEYRLEDMDWVDSNEFIDYIISGERYTVFRRMKENSDVEAYYDEIGTTVVVNGDNRIIDADSTDLAWLKKHLITTVNSNNLGADINEDGNVDIRDLVRLKKSLASIDVPSSPENTETQTINPKIGLKLNTSYYHVVDWDDGSCLSEYQFDGSELLCLAVYDTNKEYAESDDSIIYKGIEYYPIGFGGPLPEYTLTDEEIILKFGEEFSGDPDYDEEYRLVVTSTYDLLVTYSTGLMFDKGDILELNSIA